ncbi:MAG: endonuclease VIII [Candidatus Pristimantibacillus lignocellulolyticus]|uniref:Formamidopyrimidine-DNA glycosylase n=1 Tax=Candidatus Pristimantibacillus lignocellulolyticus TaxID=2994561 RepID=A0A9J6ZDM6_9BACL|nr:MAG: endonuclease VIII [Candidatus Pristimantibacillus lignocellulolyticus]
MYELPELDVIRAVLAEKYAGAPITKIVVNSKALVGKKTKLSDALVHATIWFVERRAGHLILHLDTGKRLMIYLHESSRFYGGEAGEPLKSGAHLVLYFNNRYVAFYELADEAIQLLTVREVDDQLKICGPDPLDKRFTLSALQLVLGKKRNYLKTLLLDATLMTGIGAIYSDEILFEARLKPNRKANTLTAVEGEALFTAMQTVLKNAIADGGSKEQALFAQDSFTGSYNDKLKVFQREGEPCTVCSEPIQQLVVAKQKSYVCPHCQQ